MSSPHHRTEDDEESKKPDYSMAGIEYKVVVPPMPDDVRHQIMSIGRLYTREDMDKSIADFRSKNECLGKFHSLTEREQFDFDGVTPGCELRYIPVSDSLPDRLAKSAQVVIDKYNEDNVGSQYKLTRLVEALTYITHGSKVYLTFIADDQNDPPRGSKTFRIILYRTYPDIPDIRFIDIADK